MKRSQFYLLLGAWWASFSVYIWFHDRDHVAVTLGVILTVMSVLISRMEWKTEKDPCSCAK